jgi:DNA-binding MarR family transcriptional regulator
MNDKATDSQSIANDELLRYQSGRFQSLMEEIVECCEMRTSYLSRKFQLPKAELKCLMLFMGERYLTVKGISQKLDVAKSRVTKIVSGLLQKKLLTRVDDPADARVKLISLTPMGQRKAEEISALISELHINMLLELRADERRSALSAMEQLRGSMEAVKQRLV